MKHSKDEYGFFQEPVDVRLVPDYLDVVERPMDFGTIAKKVQAGSYASLEQFKVRAPKTHRSRKHIGVVSGKRGRCSMCQLPQTPNPHRTPRRPAF